MYEAQQGDSNKESGTYLNLTKNWAGLENSVVDGGRFDEIQCRQ